MEVTELHKNVSKFGQSVAIVTAVLTSITFAIAILTPPLSGPFCTADCFRYPFADIAGRFPRDYYWMYPAMVLMVPYLMMMISVHQTVTPEKKHFSLISISFAIISTVILFADYYLQVSVIQPSILAGETDGISLLSQYNPHGIFIVLEEMGFLFMNISFLSLIPVFSIKNNNQKAIKWISAIGFLLILVSFILISFLYGIMREYRFEVAVISITWIELILLGFLYARYFKRY
jgi:hypothetical protein